MLVSPRISLTVTLVESRRAQEKQEETHSRLQPIHLCIHPLSEVITIANLQSSQVLGKTSQLSLSSQNHIHWDLEEASKLKH